MRKINIFLLMCVIFGMTFLSVSASNYVYLNTQTIQRLDNDLKNYRGDKEVYINSMISRINTMIQKETSVTQRRVLVELRSYYQTQKNDLTNVDRVVDELFGTRVEYTPTYNRPDMPVAFSPIIRTQGTSSSVVELRWGWVDRATYYQIRFNNGNWSNNWAHTNHLRTMTCGTSVTVQVRACNSSGCSGILNMNASSPSCTYNNYNNNYNYNYNNYNNTNTLPYSTFAQFRSTFLSMYQKWVITNAEYNRAIRDLESYNNYTSANQFYEWFLKTAYHAHIIKFYSEARSRNVITDSEYNTRVGSIYNRMYTYWAQAESIYNQELQTAKNLFRLHALNVVDRLLQRWQVTSTYRTQVLNRFDAIYNTNELFLEMFDQLMRDLNNFEYSNNSDFCSIQLGGVTYRVDSCTKTFSMRKWYGNQEFWFTIFTNDSNRRYFVEVLPDVVGLPYGSITGWFYSGNAQWSQYISKFFVDSNLSRVNYSWYVRIRITDNFGNTGELRQQIQLNVY